MWSIPLGHLDGVELAIAESPQPLGYGGAATWAEYCSDTEPVGEMGPSTVKKFGNPGTAVMR